MQNFANPYAGHMTVMDEFAQCNPIAPTADISPTWAGITNGAGRRRRQSRELAELTNQRTRIKREKDVDPSVPHPDGVLLCIETPEYTIHRSTDP